MSKPGPQPTAKVSPPTWDKIGKPTPKRRQKKAGPFAELASELADRQVTSLLVDAVVNPKGKASNAAKHASASTAVSTLANLRLFSAIAPQKLRWLWPGRIPLGKLTLFVGDPGLGKSLLTLDAAARLSRGTPWPDEEPCEPGDTIILSAEDDAADTIRPRLDAAGADVSRVHLLESVRVVTADGKSVESGFSLERDISVLEDVLKETGARFVSIDPVSAYLGGTDSHANAEVRGLLAPLAALAAKYAVTVVAVTHLRKSAGAAIHRAIGSLAFAAGPRAVWGITADPENKSRRLFLPVKMNLAPDGDGLAYHIEAPNGIAKITWESGPVAVDVNAAMGGFETPEGNSERCEAEQWLREYLADGPVAAGEVIRTAAGAGISKATLWRAAHSLKVVKRKLGGRGAGWEWSLRKVESKNSQSPNSVCVNSLNPLNSLDSLGSKNSKNPTIQHIDPVKPLTQFEEGEA